MPVLNRKLDYVVLDMIESVGKNLKTQPLNLGGIAGAGGGIGGPPGGFIGTLPQVRVSYDSDELSSLSTPASGMSLLDNLNHIRYRLDIIESGASIYIVDDNTPVTYADVTVLHFSGAGFDVYDLGGGEVQIVGNATGSGGGIEEAPIDGSTYGRKDAGWVVVSGGGATTFTGLTDTPSDYVGHSGKSVVVNGTEDGLEFTTISGGGIGDAPADGSAYARKDNSWTTISGSDVILTDFLDYYTSTDVEGALQELGLERFDHVNVNGASNWEDYGGGGTVAAGYGRVYVRAGQLYEKFGPFEKQIATIDEVPSTFLDLSDTPTTYSGSGNRVVVVSGAEDALAFMDAREVLTANRTYYVRSDGSNSNTGLVDSAGGAFLTFQYAVNIVKNTLDLGGYTVTIDLDGRTYSENVEISGIVGGELVIKGTMSELDSLTASSGVEGSGATRPSVTRSTGTWTADARAKKSLRFTSGNNSGKSLIIESNTTTVATNVGWWSGGAISTDTFVVEDWSTIIQKISILDKSKVVLEDLKFTNGSADDCLYLNNAFLKVKRCFFLADSTGAQAVIRSYNSSVEWVLDYGSLLDMNGNTTASSFGWISRSDYLKLEAPYFYQSSKNRDGLFMVYSRLDIRLAVFNGFNNAISFYANGASSFAPSATPVYTVIKNATTGVFATSGSVVLGLTNNQYSGNTTNQNIGREVLTATRNYYVRTDGSDNNTGLSDTAAGAFLTVQKAFNTITTLDKNGYDVYVYVGSGTFSEDVVASLGEGEGTVYLYGTLSLQETATSASVAAGSGATQGTVTKTGQWTGNVYANFLAYFVTDNAYRIIDSHTNDVLTLCGTAPSSTTQNVSVYGWGTTIKSIDVSERGVFHCYNCKFDNTTYSVTTGVFSNPTFEQCYIDYGITTYSQLMTLEKCSIRSELTRGIWVKQGKLIAHYSKVLLGATGSAFYVIDGANVEVQQGTVVDGAGFTGTYGVYIFGNASANMFGSSSNGYPRIRNWASGIYTESGGQVYNTTNVQYSSNTVNEDFITGKTYYTTSTYEFYRGAGLTINAFTATINGTPSGSTLVYNAPSAGNEEDLEQYDSTPAVATDNLAKMVLHNTTRGTDLVVLSVNKTTNTITFTSAVPGAWANGDTITTLRPSGAFQMRALQIYDTSVIPANATHVLLSLQLNDTAAANKAFWICTDKNSPSGSEVVVPANVQVTNQYVNAPLFAVPITNRRIMMHHRGTSGTVVLRVAGYVK